MTKEKDVLTVDMIRKAVKILTANPMVCHFCKGKFTDFACSYYLSRPLPVCRSRKCNKKLKEMIEFLAEDMKKDYGRVIRN